jgi:hypothetical protein
MFSFQFFLLKTYAINEGIAMHANLDIQITRKPKIRRYTENYFFEFSNIIDQLLIPKYMNKKASAN